MGRWKAAPRGASATPWRRCAVAWLACVVRGAAADELACAARLPPEVIMPVASVEIAVHWADATQVVTSLRWPHESAAEAAQRFCAEHKIHHESVPEEFRSAATDEAQCARELSARLRPDVEAAAAETFAGFLGSLYDARTQLALGAQMAIAAAIRRSGPRPRVLAFGAGHDSRLVCAAAADGGVRGSVMFVEEDAAWADVVRAELAELARDRGLPNDACEVVVTATPTRRAHWVEYLGYDAELAAETVARLWPGAPEPPTFDVVVVDGPCGCNDVCAGRMAAIATAAAVADPDGGVVFVDDLSRTVERVWAHAVLRPKFAREALVANTVLNHFKYWTHDALLYECVLEPSSAAVARIADNFGLLNIFRPGSPDALSVGYPPNGDDATEDDHRRAKAMVAEMTQFLPPLDGPPSNLRFV